jgi:glycosyltransferase involved in cell wall biosynthesis
MVTERLKVVVMVDSLEHPGGGERLAVENAALLDPGRFEVTFCLSRWRPTAAGTEPTRSSLERLESAGVEVLRIERTRLAVWAWRPLLALLHRRRVDIVHAHLFGSNFWAVVLGRLAGVRAIVAHEHIWSYEGRPLRRFLDRHLIARFASVFVAVSEDGRRLMVERERIDPGDIVVIPNGIEDRPHGDGSKAQAELGLGPEAFVVGTVGNLRAQKALEVLIEAAALLRHQVPGLRVMIAGEGPERDRLEEEIASRGLGEVVALLGARDDVPGLLDAFDLAVCCSDFEGSPLSVMEYMQAGLAVVGTRIGGLEGLVIDGETGTLVPPRDPAALAAALARLAGDPERRRALGARGEELCRKSWRLDTWIGRIEALYLRLTGAGDAEQGRSEGQQQP